ncbi:hypothetical protein OG937_27965 [Streptomyces sp. NBC_00510]
MSEHTLESAIELLKQILRIETQTDQHIFLKSPAQASEGQAVARFEVSELREAIERLNKASSVGSGLDWGQRCEFLVAMNGSARLGHLREEEVDSSDENGLKFRLGAPSLEYALHLLFAARKDGPGSLSAVTRNIQRRLREIRYAVDTESDEYVDSISLADFLGRSLSFTTLQIGSPKNRQDFQDIADAFLFQLAYNYDLSYRVPPGFDHLFSLGQIRRRRRAGAGAPDAPRMTYSSDLVHHYQLAVSAESPMLQYLSYYHIAEHFFEKVFNDDFVEQVRRKIADPSFSLKRSKDIQGIIKLVTATQRRVRDEGGVDEQRALMLVLERFVDNARLVADIRAHDDALIQHYKACSPSFSENVLADLTLERDAEVRSALAKRIYMTRNSLVHAKDGARPRYFPFVNDAELIQEIPLVRFCAEQIIIAHGRII